MVQILKQVVQNLYYLKINLIIIVYLLKRNFTSSPNTNNPMMMISPNNNCNSGTISPEMN